MHWTHGSMEEHTGAQERGGYCVTSVYLVQIKGALLYEHCVTCRVTTKTGGFYISLYQYCLSRLKGECRNDDTV